MSADVCQETIAGVSRLGQIGYGISLVALIIAYVEMPNVARQAELSSRGGMSTFQASTVFAISAGTYALLNIGPSALVYAVSTILTGRDARATHMLFAIASVASLVWWWLLDRGLAALRRSQMARRIRW